MTKIRNVSLDKMVRVASNSEGNKLYKVERKERGSIKGDVILMAMLDTKREVYHYEQEFWYYGYEKSKKIYFDGDIHPHWNASFNGEEFRLYDGIFLGNYGCTGRPKFLGMISGMRRDLFSSGHKEVIEEFDKFYERYSRSKGDILGDKIRSFFGLSVEVNSEEEEFADYLRYEDEHVDTRVFWKWFINSYVDGDEYEHKIDVVTHLEQEEAFKSWLGSTINRLKGVGFKKTRDD